MHLVLREEACRIADRLDRLDDHLDGRPWLDFIAEEASGGAAEVRVVIDRVLPAMSETGGLIHTGF